MRTRPGLRCVATLAMSSLGAALLSSCFLPGAVCTEIGCANEIVLTVTTSEGAPVTSFHGSVDISGQVVPFTCPSLGNATPRCNGNELRIDSAAPPASVFVDVESGDRALRFQGSVSLERETSRPNGPQCEPECVTGRATVPLN